jgi:hypothetical protein
MRARLLGLAAGSLLCLASGLAFADPMDPAIERLVLDPNCWAGGERNPGAINDRTSDAGDLLSGPGQRQQCAPDHAAFKKLISQLGFAFAPTAMHSARTTGFGGFHLSIEGVYTDIDQGAAYWHKGTQGTVDPNTNEANVSNPDPSTILQLYSLKLRKSFGFGLELTAAVGFMPQTSILSGGADVRLSLLEGFRSGLPGILPDIAVGGGVRTITGTPQLQLTVAGLDAQVSKPLPIADSSIITPWVGFQYLWIFGDSGLVDLTPETDAVGYCNFSGINVPGNSDPSKAINDGQPVCNGGSPLDFNNNVVFDNARLERQRLIFGVSYRYEVVMFGIEFITDIVDPGDAQAGNETTRVPVQDRNGVWSMQSVSDSELLKDEPRQWSLVLELGAMF